MIFRLTIMVSLLSCSVTGAQSPSSAPAPGPMARGPMAPAPTELGPRPSNRQALEEAKASGASRSSYRTSIPKGKQVEASKADLETFRAEIEPAIRRACYECHSSDSAEGEFRIDKLNPDLIEGEDVHGWLRVLAAISKGEMPPEDGPELGEDDRNGIVQWLTEETRIASQLHRAEPPRGAEQPPSSFRRMTRYEYDYVMQDLLGLPYRFNEDLPPETSSEDGFQNSSEMLHMSVVQFESYRDLARKALRKATVRGERPQMVYYGITMADSAALMNSVNDAAFVRINEIDQSGLVGQGMHRRQLSTHKRNVTYKPGDVHFKDLETGERVKSSFDYRFGRMSHYPKSTRPEIPINPSHVFILPANKTHKIDLGVTVPASGMLRVRVRASQASTGKERFPSLHLRFGFQESNNAETWQDLEGPDVAIRALPGEPQFYEWELSLSELRRNPFRGNSEIESLPNPTEYMTFTNVYPNPEDRTDGDILIDYIEMLGPIYQQWPPRSHTNVFVPSENITDEAAYAREILADFLPRAWRRVVTESEIDQKVDLFIAMRPGFDDFQDAIIEVLATVLSSPKFLYLVQADPDQNGEGYLTQYELATRLSMLLWSSTPDRELLSLAESGQLGAPKILAEQMNRMLVDRRSQRFANHFVRQWLGLELLDYLEVQRKLFPEFDGDLKAAMQQEPVHFFQDVLQRNGSVMDFIHADYALLNERLATHYGISGVHGDEFQRVTLDSSSIRGGLITQAGLLAMNSDGTDSHPLKRGVWLLEKLLHDPPSPPPAVVPQIDLADPDIAKLTLKERIERHRDDPACISCHAKIDPWGIALENFDAVGKWREQLNGEPVDASSRLFNKQRLDGIVGLKRFLLANRQDQFARAMVHKMTTYALGRPLTFGDRAELERIAAQLRQGGDGLQTLIRLLIESDLFQKT